MSQFILRLDQQDVAIVSEALAAQPLGKAIQTFLRIQQQVQEQTASHMPRPPDKHNGAQQVLEE